METVTIILLAARYSFAFCWRNSKIETVGRLSVSIFNTVIGYLSIQATGFIINGVQSSMGKTEISNDLIVPIAFLITVLLSGVVLGRFNWFYRSKWNQSLRYANQRELNDHRATLDVARFRSKEYDDLSKRIQELPWSWQTRIFFSEEMFNLFTTLVSFALFGASLLWYKPTYAFVLMVVALPMVVSEFKMVALWWDLFQELVPQHKKRSVLEKPYHSSNAFVQAIMFNQMPALRRDIDINVNSILEAYDCIRKINLQKEMVTHFIAMIGLCGVAIHAIWSTVVLNGEIGTLTIIMAASRTFQGNLESIVSLIAEQWNSAKGVILIEKDFLGLKPVLQTKYPVVPNFDIVPQIRFEHVDFAYPDTEKLVLEDVSFTIEPGSKVAIVGKSGHGKSTIQALLMRHYDPTSGTIYADKIDLRNIEPQVWSNVASALTQEYTVLERCIGAEIASSRLDQSINIEAVTASSRFANFDEVADSDPKGYESQIGVEFGGRDFSGGERQRLALARVHYRGTPILILDEPDARLDPESAQKVIDKVFELKDITVVMITHHVSRAERCDKVIVMQKGKVAEQGTHQELTALGGIYFSMCEKDKERLGTVETNPPKSPDSEDPD
ncbi:MAG: ABC transporter related protein [Parcubacteria group bacterium GW2011_GWC1_43_11b]|nr:MAG: ABC transporter related protein [Parcubacteria group bacterium GW2011_GWC1_43_11b]